MYIDLHVMYPLLSSDFGKLEYFRQIFEKYSNIKFHENPSNRSRVVQRGRTVGQSDTTKLTLSLRNFANAPNEQFWTRQMNYVRPSQQMLLPFIENISEVQREEDKNKDAQTWFAHLSFTLSQHDKRMYIFFFFVFGEFLTADLATGFDSGN